jgi:hypothetical protein
MSQAALDAMVRVGGVESGSSWLRRVLDCMPGVGNRRNVDFEDLDWRGLRPGALRPLRTPDDIAAALNGSSTTWRRALPGAGEAARFAQRLGIGRHLPCLVMFTDIGDRCIHVLPLAGRKPDDIHARLLGWIDRYYEVNRHTLERWSTIEKEVSRCAADARATLDTVRTWSDRRRGDLRWLTRIAELLLDLEDGDAVKSIARDYSAPYRLRDVIRRLDDALARCEAQERTARARAAVAEQVRTAADLDVCGPQRGRGTGGLERTTLRAGDPHNGASPRRPVAGHTLPGKCFPDGVPARGGDVWIDGTAHGDVPVPLELLDLAAVHGTSLPNTPRTGHPISGRPHTPRSWR